MYSIGCRTASHAAYTQWAIWGVHLERFQRSGDIVPWKKSFVTITSGNVEKRLKNPKNLKIFWKRPNASNCFRMHPNASQWVRMDPQASKSLRKPRKTCENFEKLRENFEKLREKFSRRSIQAGTKSHQNNLLVNSQVHQRVSHPARCSIMLMTAKLLIRGIQEFTNGSCVRRALEK